MRAGVVLATIALAFSTPLSASDREPDFAAARALLDEGDFQRAATGFEQVAAKFAARYAQTDTQRYYCAHNGPETLVYAALHAKENVNVDVLGPDWCDALFFQAYSYVELKQLDRALVSLQQAIGLSPFNASYLIELGFVLRSLGQLDEAMEAYRQSLGFAGLSGEETRWSAAAWRGICWIHAERREWDPAEEACNKSLEFEPDNKTALGELQYIAENRPRD